MQAYLSRKAKLGRLSIGVNVVVLGESEVGDNSFLDSNVILGYPVRAKLIEALRYGSQMNLDFLDRISSGCKVGSRCIVRSGCILYEGSVIEDEVELGHYVLIRENVRIGKGSRIGSYTVLDGHISVGRKTCIQTGCYLPPKTTVGEEVFLGPYTLILNDKYPPSGRLVGVKIGRGVVVGAGSIILPGVALGDKSVIAAGSIVTRDVDPYTVVKGSPARPYLRRDVYEEKMREYQKG